MHRVERVFIPFQIFRFVLDCFLKASTQHKTTAISGKLPSLLAACGVNDHGVGWVGVLGVASVTAHPSVS